MSFFQRDSVILVYHTYLALRLLVGFPLQLLDGIFDVRMDVCDP